MNFRNFAEVTMIMGTLPLAMVGSVWLMYLQGFNFSIAAGVGFITLTGVVCWSILTRPITVGW